MGQQACLQRFAGIADRELEALNRLIDVLDEERNALAQNDAEALPVLIAGKTGHLEALAQCASERARVLADAGVPAQGEEIRRFLAPEPRAAETWDKLLAAARKAAGLNTANAFLTSNRLASVSRALAVLAGPQPCLYGPQGTATRGPTAPRALVRG